MTARQLLIGAKESLLPYVIYHWLDISILNLTYFPHQLKAVDTVFNVGEVDQNID